MSQTLARTLETHLEALTPQLTAWRRDFHRHAESGWVEFRTASMVAEELDRLGYQVTLGRDVVADEARMGVPDADTLAREEARARAQGAIERWLPQLSGGFTGVVGVLDTGRPGPTIGYRIDMDALDLDESRESSHRPAQQGFGSQNAGMMHACGPVSYTHLTLPTKA